MNYSRSLKVSGANCGHHTYCCHGGRLLLQRSGLTSASLLTADTKILCLLTEKGNLTKLLLPLQDPGRCLILWSTLIGLGPHNPKKKQDLDKLYDLKAKAQQIMNQFGPSTLINLSNFSSIKPEPASTPPQSSMANSTTVAKMPGTPSGGGRLSPESNQVLTKKKLQDLVREVDPNEQLDEDVEEMLLQIADDFIESVVTAACQLARHRKSNTLEVKDVQLHLERQWNMWIPGFGSEEIRPYKKACTTEAHKQRMALIRKTTKK
ncbi:PREDICTED: transcription initiation factor TFIID subunit 12 isoform X1 [Haliaeetus leucocephalus]|uniref:transcription initiation factor TFIID subunit 12 isoform X1 n=1 Tax=Haliaeetus leucocephalus TaxID=52644 RepID=UPI0005225DB1|nr:PREDICTED: transcription initiation factor TFIID subunit 12 isoform X1 [Haliaeetus albicilla]XP_010574501.1 PREDICTED: transcription initiation factor TFIID subunit 12 isoform X1 [Haliaeetus leucocephalus]